MTPLSLRRWVQSSPHVAAHVKPLDASRDKPGIPETSLAALKRRPPTGIDIIFIASAAPHSPPPHRLVKLLGQGVAISRDPTAAAK